MPTYRVTAHYVLGGYTKEVNSEQLLEIILNGIKLSPTGSVEISEIFNKRDSTLHPLIE